MSADAHIDRLYGLPLDEFTAARNEAAKELRESGDRDAADTVKSLRKPSAAAWALNRAARERPGELKAFLEAATRLADAQQALLESGDRDALNEALEDERAAAAALAGAAEELGGGAASLRDRVDATLRAALTDEDVRARLEAGRLVEDHEASGFGALAAAPARKGAAKGTPAGGGRRAAQKAAAKKAGPGPAAKPGGAREEKRKQKLRAELESAEDAQRRAARRVRDADVSVASARERAEAAMETLEAAQREEREAAAAAEEANAEVARLRAELR